MQKHSSGPHASGQSILDLTFEEVQRQQRDYGEKRRVITEELAAIFAARAKGETPAPVFSDREKSVRERMRGMLNGHAPEALKAAIPALDRENELLIERDAIDGILTLLTRSEIPARAAAAVAWVETHEKEWRELAREIVLTAFRLAALEARAESMSREIPDCVPGLALVQFVGFGHSFLANPNLIDSDSSLGLRAVALKEGIVTTSEIKKVIS